MSDWEGEDESSDGVAVLICVRVSLLNESPAVCFCRPVGSSDRGSQEMPRPTLDNRNIAAASASLRGVCTFAQTQSREGIQAGGGGLDERWRRNGMRPKGSVEQSGERGFVEAHKGQQQQQQACDKAEVPKRGRVTRKRSAKGSGGSVCSFLGCSNPIIQNSSSSSQGGESCGGGGGGGKGGGRGRGRPASFACAEHQGWYERVSRKGQACQHNGCTTQVFCTSSPHRGSPHCEFAEPLVF